MITDCMNIQFMFIRNHTKMSKVFCIGESKTGTSSFGVAMRRCFGINHLRGSWISANELCSDELMLGSEESKVYLKVFDFIKKGDSFDDQPFGHGEFYKILHEKYPNAKFVLTVRDGETWYRSMFNQLSLRIGPRRPNDVEGKFTPYYNCQRNGYVALGKHIKITYGENIFNKEEAIKIFENRNREIIEFFNQFERKLLVLDIEAATAEENMGFLSEFLSHKSKCERYPLANKTPTSHSPKKGRK